MKDYPEPIGRILDVIEIILTVILAFLLCFCVYLAVYFARNILEGV